ncbi:MAG: PAS domain S-box protein, partial [Syntrophus sp. (in: bacteria)]
CMGMNDYPAPIAHQDDRERMMKVFNSSVQCSIGKNVEFRILCKDGIVKWAEVAYQPIYDENGENLGHRASIRDITARRQAEQQLYIHQIELTSQNEELHRAQEELEAARMRYFDLYDLAPVGYFTVSEPGLIQETNLTATKMLGVVRADLIKQPLTRFILKEDQDVFYRVHKHLFDTWVPQVCEMRMIRTDGTAFWAHTETTAALDDDGTPLCRVAVINISASKQAEEELRRHRESLERVVEVRTADLKKKGVDLEETNIALKVILQKREEGEKILETTFLDNIQKLIVPYMEELRRLNLTEPQKNCVNLIECSLRQITAPFLQNLTARFAGFTSREIQVAHMIREGKSTKEIASTFNCSTRSVEFHRDNIRKKLQLSDRKANLHAYLLGLPEK